MLLKTISKIDEDKCVGCGGCIQACHQGALQLVNGKARLVAPAQCDGLGMCLPVCPNGAIILEEQPVVQEAVSAAVNTEFRCPGNVANLIERKRSAPVAEQTQPVESQLQQWPCQIKLVPPAAGYFHQADILVAADCTAYAYANIHQDFMRDKITLIGCPKLDEGSYADKLGQIFQSNSIRSVTVLRMEKPCCSGLANAAREALANSGKQLPFKTVIIGIDGSILETREIFSQAM